MHRTFRRRVNTAWIIILVLAVGQAVAQQEEGTAASQPASPLEIRLDPSQVVNDIDVNIYGHFLEHIYQSVNGGLWGELVWNRTFEMWSVGSEAWSVEDGVLTQVIPTRDVRLLFGEPDWGDFEYSVEVRREGRWGFFSLPFRVDGENGYTVRVGGRRQDATYGIMKNVAGQERWTQVAEAGEGSVEGDRWYKVRLRCEGNRFQLWVDGEQVLDAEDTEDPLFRGQFAVLTPWGSTQYRSFRVASLDGEVLMEGLPEITDIPKTPHFWEPYGPVTLGASPDALNTDQSIRLAKREEAEGGIRQANYSWRKQPYTGSLWVKGEDAHGVVVRMQDGERTLAETTITRDEPGAEWQEHRFTMTPSAETKAGALQVGILGEGEVLLDQVSLMGRDALDTGGFRPDLLEATQALQAPVIRWPGGCFASVYRWKYGVGPQHERRSHPLMQWDDRDPYAFGTDEFIRYCRAVGAEPIIVVNTGKGSACAAPGQEDPYPTPEEWLQEALDWIEYCNGPADSKWGAVRAANGHPEPYHVKYWEIDNETWSAGPEWYADAVNRFGPAMREKDPSMTLIACGGNRMDQEWNQHLLDHAAGNFDLISVHSYFDPEDYADGPVEYEAFLEDLADRILKSSNPNMKIYNSEWNAQSIDLRTGLFAGGILNVFERQGENFVMGGPALMYRHQSAAAWNNAFMNFDHTGMFVAPNYVVTKLWREHYQPRRIAAEGDSGDLNLVATRSDDGKTVVVKVVNPTERAVTARLLLPAGTAIDGASVQVVTAPALETENSLEQPEAVRAVPGRAGFRDNAVGIVFPRHSASALTIKVE